MGQDEEDPGGELALLSLIAALTLADVEEVQKRNKGKSRAGGPADDEMLAFELFAEEAAALDTLASDIRFAQSLDKALESDAHLLDDLARAEETCRRDREFAIALSKGQPYRYEPVPRSQPVSASSLRTTSSPAIVVTALPKVIAPASSKRASTTLSFATSSSSTAVSAATAKAQYVFVAYMKVCKRH
ncbi:hypothetical protein BC628DRAFT_1420258 [Trametes gibbosa]|nr:hypothetical protein BC628DRAFT_1420258 [Trametes gibbosa]